MKKLFAFVALIAYVMSLKIRKNNECEDSCILENECFSSLNPLTCLDTCQTKCSPNDQKNKIIETCMNTCVSEKKCLLGDEQEMCLNYCLYDCRYRNTPRVESPLEKCLKACQTECKGDKSEKDVNVLKQCLNKCRDNCKQ